MNKWYWNKQSYNEYQLIGYHTLLTFPSYDKLHAYCKQHQIDAIQS